MTGGVAAADVTNDCLKDLRPEIRVRACTEIIADPQVGSANKAAAYVSRGKARTDAGALQPALTDFTEAIHLQKDNASAFAGRGRANLYIGQLARSIADFTEAIRLSPTAAELYVERGHAYTASGNLNAAIDDFTHAITLDPRSWSAFNERGVAYFKNNQPVEALDDFNRAIAIFPWPEIYANRGHANETLARPKDAIEDFRNALLNDPSLVDARDALRRLGAEGAIITETDQRVSAGAALAEQHCSICHAIANAGASPNKDAPPFRNINLRRPLYWLREPITRSIFATHEKMPQFNLSFSELDTVVAYINSLSAVQR